MGNTNPGWKKFERRICRHHGVERKPLPGRQTDKFGADNEEHPLFVIQCKLDKRLPDYISDVVRGTAAKAHEGGKVGIVVWKRPEVRDDNAVVMLRYADWRELHGAAFDLSAVPNYPDGPGRPPSAGDAT
jgi:hypothetical protein